MVEEGELSEMPEQQESMEGMEISGQDIVPQELKDEWIITYYAKFNKQGFDKLKNDYKEVNIGNISLQDKDIIAEIEDKMSNIVRGNVVDDNGNPIENISKLFEKNDITSLYISSNNGATLRFNQAFNEYFESIIGKPFEMASIIEVDRFFSDRNNFNISRYGGTLANYNADYFNLDLGNFSAEDEIASSDNIEDFTYDPNE